MKHGIAITILAFTASAHAQTLATAHWPIYSTTLWTQFAQGPQNHARSNAPLVDLSAPLWISDGDESTTIAFLPQSGVVADETQVYALGYDINNPADDLVAAFNKDTGDLLWTAPIPAAIFDSWSTPAIDLPNEIIVAASGQFITAIDTNTGTQLWQTQLDRPIVNASPTITHDLRNQDRLFITDYSFAGGTPGQLYCINIDPFDPITNPYQPGQRVWTVMLSGSTSGNTPAYAGGKVFVATTNSLTNSGLIYRFDATTTQSPTEDWVAFNPEPLGFFSGVSIANNFVYASSYNFSVGQHNSNTLKVDANTGTIIWSAPSTRTDVSPIVLADGRVLVSAGVQTGAFSFFGSIPTINLLASDGTLLWDSALATLDDTNNNDQYDPGETFLSIGGWTHQPIVVQRDNQAHLYVGTLANPDLSGFFAPSTDLRIIDLNLNPTDPGFIVDHFIGAGSTPAIADGILYTIGVDGLHSFAPPTPSRTINNLRNNTITIEHAIKALQSK